jgi:hypothetical protein
MWRRLFVSSRQLTETAFNDTYPRLVYGAIRTDE